MNNKTQKEDFSIYEFFLKFPDEQSARLHFEKYLWNDGAKCPYCHSYNAQECKNQIPMPYRCRDCRKHFSVRTNTVLAESRLGLHKWLLAMYILTSSRKGVSSVQLAKHLGVTQKTAWFLAHRIRQTWKKHKNKLSKHVEVDETYIGGKEKNKHSDKKLKKGRGAVGKIAVMGMLERKGEVKALIINSTDKQTLVSEINDSIDKHSFVYTDSFKSYYGIKGYNHEVVNHSVGEYVRDQAHTNGIESFWALLKRGYYGIYHHMSKKHLQKYVNEFSHRHNTSSLSLLDCINKTIILSTNCHLSYNELING